MIKKFYEMVSDDHIGTIKDILDDKILDDYDVYLNYLGICEEGIFREGDISNYIYRYYFPNKPKNSNTSYFDKHGIELMNSPRKLWSTSLKKSILIQLGSDPSYIMSNIEIVDKIKLSVNTIKSITGLETSDFVIFRFTNSIQISQYARSNYLEVDWSNPDVERINKWVRLYSGGFSDPKIIISILFKIG